MPSSKSHVLITRPEKTGRVLAQQLKNIGIISYCQPLFAYQTLADLHSCKNLLQKSSQTILIFVSVAAVEFANQTLNFSQWRYQSIIAVGTATQSALQKLGLTVITPKVHTSEGILSLDILSEVNNQYIIIVRGDGGREHLGEQLKQRGAVIYYLESYQKIWLKLNENHVNEWQNQQINCIVITSNALLESIVHLIKNSDSYWRNTCLWIVASERIARQAKQLGLLNVVNAHGANDHAILCAITSHGKNND